MCNLPDPQSLPLSWLQAAWRNRAQWHIVLDFLKQQAGERLDLEKAVFKDHCNHPNDITFSGGTGEDLWESWSTTCVLSVRLK